MGKKGVILDNGRTAQSSMALYWKNNRDRSKNPKQKVDHQQKQDEISDKRVMSNFQKWKMHKQKLITKAYTKPAEKVSQQVQINKKISKQEDEMLEQMFEKKKPKIITVPGFKSKNDLASKLQFQKPKQADQSTNVLRLPGVVAGLTQQQIVQMLKQRKSKQQMMKNHQVNRHQGKQSNISDKQDVLLGEQFIDLLKKKDRQQKEEQERKQIQEMKLPEPAYFKSQILNKVQKQGVEKGLQSTVKRTDLNSEKEQQIKQTALTQGKKQAVPESTNNQASKGRLIGPKFIPRALKK